MKAKRIPEYDVAALRNNIAKLRREIEAFREIAQKSEHENRREQAEVFHRAIAKAEQEIKELEDYVKQIGIGKLGNTIRPD